jgi:hypothetical protein
MSTLTQHDLYEIAEDVVDDLAVAVSMEMDEYNRLRREGRTNGLSFNEWLLRRRRQQQDANTLGPEDVQQHPQIELREWAYGSDGDAERTMGYERARHSAAWLSEYWDTHRLRGEPVRPVPLWRRNSSGSRQPVRRRTPAPDHPFFGPTMQEAESRRWAYHERNIGVWEAQVTQRTSIPFHFTYSLCDGHYYYIQGADSADAPPQPWHSQHRQSFPIPTPNQRHGTFHERVAWPMYTDTTTFTITAATTTTSGRGNWTTIQDAYYMQNGNWSGPYTVTVPGQVMWEASTASQSTHIFRPPQYDNTYDMGLQPPDLRFNQGWNIGGPPLPPQELGDTPECNFTRIVERHEIETAYQNSKRLLKEWLRPDEYYSLIKFGFMIVPSKLYPDVDYWIYDDDFTYVDAFNNDHTQVAEKFCLHSTESKFQKYDKILAKVMLLKADEAEFLRRAIPHGGDNGCRYEGNGRWIRPAVRRSAPPPSGYGYGYPPPAPPRRVDHEFGYRIVG